MRHLALFILPLLIQDPADTVRALIEKLQSDDIAVRSQAQAELLKLGPSSLLALRAIEAKSSGEFGVMLRSLISRVEIHARTERLMGSATVTLDHRDADIKKVVAEMARQTGLDITSFVLDSEHPVTLSCDRVPVWKAVDDLCRAYGGLAPEYSHNRIIVKDRVDRGTPVTLHRSLGVHFSPARRLEKGNLRLYGALTYPPGLPVWSKTAHFDEITDGAGTSLVEPEWHTKDAPYLESLHWEQGPPDQFCSWFTHQSASAVADKATKLSRIRGTVVVKLAVEFKSLAKADHPLKEGEALLEGRGYKLSLAAERKDGKVKLQVKVLEPLTEGRWSGELFRRGSKKAFAFRDDRGELYFSASKTLSLHDERKLHLEAVVPDGCEIIAFELLEIRDFAEIRIPFDYTDVPFSAKD